MGIKVLLVDVGGVLLTNGWDTDLRNQAAAHFKIDPEELQQRHEMIFEDFECGKCSFDEYLHHVIFFKKRAFSMDEIKSYIFSTYRPYSKTIHRVKQLKARHHAKLALISNEGREIAEYRFKMFNFHDFVDYFIVSSFVGERKPDPRIYKLALDLCQENPRKVLYLDDREHYFPYARALGIRTACLRGQH